MKNFLIFFINLTPKWLVKFVVRRGVAGLRRRHSDVMKRLSPTFGKTIYADFTDLGYCVATTITETGVDVEVLVVAPQPSSLKGEGVNPEREKTTPTPALPPQGGGSQTKPNLSLKGKFFDLISIIEGKVDGDALFFSRKIEVEGDTETLIIIRNAFDSADICLIKEFILSIVSP